MAALDARLLDGFTAAGWDAGRDEFTARNVWAWAPGGGLAVEPVDSLAGVNVVAVKEGDVPDAVVVVAHHDTVPGSGGADDNGSGVVALLELARLLGPLRFHHTLVLAAVDHEELGFHGSRRLVERLSTHRPVSGRSRTARSSGRSSARCWATPRPYAAASSCPPASARCTADRSGRSPHASTGGLPRGHLPALGAAARDLLRGGIGVLAGPSAPILLRAPTDLPLVGPVLQTAVPFARTSRDHVPFWEAGLPAVQLTDTANFRH